MTVDLGQCVEASAERTDVLGPCCPVCDTGALSIPVVQPWPSRDGRAHVWRKRVRPRTLSLSESILRPVPGSERSAQTLTGVFVFHVLFPSAQLEASRSSSSSTRAQGPVAP